MIRPLTAATFLLACGSGLYLYQSKHEVQLLDRTIERTVHETGTLREQSRLLVAEWTMMNDPERLRRFSDTYLSLKTITPTQFTSLADLGSRLPAPSTEVPPHGANEPEGMPIPIEGVPAAAVPVPFSVTDELLPVPPLPTAPPATVMAPVLHPTAASRPTVADSQLHVYASEQRGTRAADARPEVRLPVAQPMAPASPAAATPQLPAGLTFKPIALATPKPLAVATQTVTKMPFSGSPAPSGPAMVAASGSYTGSLLGMARGSVHSPAPRPIPLNATYNAN